MSDLIKREDAIRALYKYSFVSKDVIEREIKAIPSADTDISEYSDKLWKNAYERGKADRPQGEWKSVKASIYPYGYDVECSVCGFRMGSSFGYKYCPNCGAYMKGADDDR